MRIVWLYRLAVSEGDRGTLGSLKRGKAIRRTSLPEADPEEETSQEDTRGLHREDNPRCTKSDRHSDLQRSAFFLSLSRLLLLLRLEILSTLRTVRP